jgi:hypothetical protein
VWTVDNRGIWSGWVQGSTAIAPACTSPEAGTGTLPSLRLRHLHPLDELVEFLIRERLRRPDALQIFASMVDDAELEAATAEQDALKQLKM